MLDANHPRCLVCNNLIKVEVDDGSAEAAREAEACVNAEESDGSPLSDAPNSPAWPIQQALTAASDIEIVMASNHGINQEHTSAAPDQNFPMQERFTLPPAGTPNYESSPIEEKENRYTLQKQSTQTHGKHVFADSEEDTIAQLQAALTLLSIRCGKHMTIDKLRAGFSMVDLRKGAKVGYTAAELVHELRVLYDLPYMSDCNSH